MSKETLEHLSSLMDGELSRDAGLFLTRRLGSDRELASTWERYHLIRDCLRQPGAGMPMVDMGDRMRAALEQEPSRQPSNAWLKPLAGMAIAASVALTAIVAVGPNSEVSDVPEPFNSASTISAMPATQAASFSGAVQPRNERLNSYLIRHNQIAGNTTKGFVSFVPIIANSSDEVDSAADKEIIESQDVTPGNTPE